MRARSTAAPPAGAQQRIEFLPADGRLAGTDLRSRMPAPGASPAARPRPISAASVQVAGPAEAGRPVRKSIRSITYALLSAPTA